MPDSDDNRLVMRVVQNEQDAEKFIALNDGVTGEGPICARLLAHRPETQWSDFSLVEDQASGQVVSTTCLLPWKCQLGGVTLRVAMLEMVVTDPRYRQRGLVRSQIERFQGEVTARAFDLSIIQGIPFYYRQFGYGYALDHTRYDWWKPGDLPAAAGAYRLRDATLADVPGLAALYDQGVGRNQLCVLRSQADWHYLLVHAACPFVALEWGENGRLAGYACVRGDDDRAATVEESSVVDRNAGLALLRLLAGRYPGGLRVAGPAAHLPVQLAREVGSQARPAEQWLLRLHDPAAFLLKIRPLLERRIAQSDLAGLTADLTLNFYRRALRLQFDAGRLEQVAPAGFVDSSMGASGGDLCIPPDAFLRLAFGYRGLEELADAWPDTLVREETRPIWDILFPRFDSWLLMPY